MKKFFKAALLITFAGIMLYCFNIHSDGMLKKTIENITYREIPTKIQITDSENSDRPTLHEQVNSKLTEDEKKIYDSIYSTLSAYKTTLIITQDIDSDKLFEIVNLVLFEHPEIFWTKGDCSFSSSGKLIFSYPYTREEAQKKNALIEQKTAEILKSIDQNENDFEKSLAIFDYITKNTAYAFEEAEHINDHLDISTIEGVFLNNRAVCAGYAKAYQYLLTLSGIDSITISGYADAQSGRQNHAWTAQVIDGETYFSDATWADCFSESGDAEFVCHTFFLMTSEELEKTHTCTDRYAEIKCTSTKNNYFTKKGLYFEEYDMSAIRAKIKESIDNNELGIELKFANSDEYKKAYKNLFTDENIYLILKTIDPLSNNIKTNTINYNDDEKHNTITIFFEYN